MRATVIFTITQGNDQNEEALIALTSEYIDYIVSVTTIQKWKINKLAAGIHKNAARLHTHIAVVVDIPNEEHVKQWNKKLQKLFKLENPNYECRRTIWLDDNPKYSEEMGIAYLWKEYSDDNQIIMKEKFLGISSEEMQRLRSIGHEEYVKATAERDRNALRKQAEEDEGENIVQFIRDFTSPKNRKFNTEYGNIESMSFTQKYVCIKVAILEYYQQRYEQTGKRGFKAYSIRDKAISYMTTENICAKRELAEFLN